MNIIVHADKTLFIWINNGWSNSAFDLFMPLLTRIFDPFSMWLWVFILAYAAYRKFPGFNMTCSKTGRSAAAALTGKYLLFCLKMALIYGANTGIYQLLKYLVHRPRPFVVQDAVVRVLLTDMQYFCSFPSGHAANAFMTAVILSAIYGKHQPAFYFTAFLVALSRVYIGVHYPLDVLAGSLLGLSVTWLILRLYPLDRVIPADR